MGDMMLTAGGSNDSRMRSLWSLRAALFPSFLDFIESAPDSDQCTECSTVPTVFYPKRFAVYMEESKIIRRKRVLIGDVISLYQAQKTHLL